MISFGVHHAGLFLSIPFQLSCFQGVCCSLLLRVFFLCCPDALGSREKKRARFPKAFAGDTTRGRRSKTVDGSICCPVTSAAFDLVNCCAAIADWLEGSFSPKPCATSFTLPEPAVIGNAAGRVEERAVIAPEDAIIEKLARPSSRILGREPITLRALPCRQGSLVEAEIKLCATEGGKPEEAARLIHSGWPLEGGRKCSQYPQYPPWEYQEAFLGWPCRRPGR
jgi:hypothetical protein